MTMTTLTVIPVPRDDWLFEVRVNDRDSLLSVQRVDPAAYNWNGRCDCDTFNSPFCKGRLELGERASDTTRCEHILAVRAHLMEHVFPAMAGRRETTFIERRIGI